MLSWVLDYIDNECDYLNSMFIRQERQCHKAAKKFPFLNLNDVFWMYVVTTIIESPFNVQKVDDNIIIQFSGYVIDHRKTYTVTFTFYADHSFKVEHIMKAHWGQSNIKFMPNRLTSETTKYTASNQIIYSHGESAITYVKYQIEKDGTIKEVIDSKRSGYETWEKIPIGNSLYLEGTTNMKGKTEFYLLEGLDLNNPHSLITKKVITEGEFNQLGKDNYSMGQKLTID